MTFRISHKRILIFVISCCLLTHFHAFADNEIPNFTEPFVQKLQENPPAVYRELRKRALNAHSLGHATFEFPEMKPVLNRMINTLKQGDKTINPSWDQLGQRGTEILRANIPYHDFIRFGFEFLHAIDKDLRRREPRHTSDYHEHLAKHVIERVLSRWTEVFMFHSFVAVDEDYFLDTRTAPIHLIGNILNSLYGDGYDLTPKEYGWHDVGHIEFMEFMDFPIRNSGKYTPEEYVDRSEKVKNKIKEKMHGLKESDISLFRAARQILFEILHERGYQYDFPILRAELDTNKWVDVVRLKLQNNFWRDPPIETTDWPRLEEARLWLLATVSNFMESDFESRIQQSRIVANQIFELEIHPEKQLKSGTPRKLEIKSTDQVTAVVTSESLKKSSLVSPFAFSLAQRPALSNSPLTKENLSKLYTLLWAKQNDHQQWVLNGIPIRGSLKSVIVDENLVLRIQFQHAHGEEEDLLWGILEPAHSPSHETQELDPVLLYKMNQILQMIKSKGMAQFSYQETVKRQRVRFKEIRVTAEGKKVVDVETLTDPSTKLTVPLSRAVFVSKEAERTSSIEQTKATFESYLTSISYHDWTFHIGRLGSNHLYLQPQFIAYDSYTEKISGQHGRKWFLSEHMTQNEIVQTALASALMSAEHQARKNFFYKTRRIYGPHFNIQKLLDTTKQLPDEPQKTFSLDEVRKIISDISFPEAQFKIGEMTKDGAPGFYIQINYRNPSVDLEDTETTVGEERFISAATTESVILQKALKALIETAKLEVLQNFKVNGISIYDPARQCVGALILLCSDRSCLDQRSHPEATIKGRKP